MSSLFFASYYSSMTFKGPSVIIPKIYDFLANFNIVSSLFFRMWREYAFKIASLLLLMLVQQLPLSVSVFCLNLVSFFKAFDHTLLLLLISLINFSISLFLC